MDQAEARLFKGKITIKYYEGKTRKAKKYMGWSIKSVQRWLDEIRTGEKYKDKRSERKSRILREDVGGRRESILRIIDPKTQADPAVKTKKLYLKISARAVRDELIKRGEEAPSERSMWRILNRMWYTLKAVKKASPLKKNTRNG